jgi:hypothetical protein
MSAHAYSFHCISCKCRLHLHTLYGVLRSHSGRQCSSLALLGGSLICCLQLRVFALLDRLYFSSAADIAAVAHVTGLYYTCSFREWHLPRIRGGDSPAYLLRMLPFLVQLIYFRGREVMTRLLLPTAIGNTVDVGYVTAA